LANTIALERTWRTTVQAKSRVLAGPFDPVHAEERAQEPVARRLVVGAAEDREDRVDEEDELGCGTGYVSAWLARRGARPVGIDNSARQLETARAFQREFGIEFPLLHGAAELDRVAAVESPPGAGRLPARGRRRSPRSVPRSPSCGGPSS
jgi:SAM-dependent methyltransferase